MSEAATRAFAATLGRNASKNVSFGPIEQRTTPGSVAHVLRTAILDGTLAPGSQLREIPLAADLGVSRAPLREALGILADEGLIVKYPYRGAFVAEVSATGMSEIASLRKRLEPYAIELAIPRLTGTSRIKVTRALEDMAFGADNNDLTATVDAHMAFHRAFYELSEHKLLLDLWKTWEAQLQMFFSADHQAFADLHDMVADHERLLSSSTAATSMKSPARSRCTSTVPHPPRSRPKRPRQRIREYVDFLGGRSPYDALDAAAAVGDGPHSTGVWIVDSKARLGASLQLANLSRLAES